MVRDRCRVSKAKHAFERGLDWDAGPWEEPSGNSSAFWIDWMRNGKNEWGNKWREWCLRPCGEHSPMSTVKLYLLFRHMLEAGSGLKTLKQSQSAFPKALGQLPVPVNEVRRQQWEASVAVFIFWIRFSKIGLFLTRIYCILYPTMEKNSKKSI